MSDKRDGEDCCHGSTTELSGAEHFLVGVSPQYWSHTPMSINTLHNLGLVDGIDCIIVKNQTRSVDSHEENKSHDDSPPRQRTGVNDRMPSEVGNDSEARFIPVSKCELHGVIVNADLKSNGSSIYLLDDGTGVVDCIQWVDNVVYSLPSLVPNDEQGPTGSFRVGDIVRVFGKIKCVSIGRLRHSIKAHGREWKVQDCVREVHVTAMSCLPINSQSNHWLRCMQFSRRAFIASAEAENTQNSSELGTIDHFNYLKHIKMMADPVHNGPDVLRLLGSEIASKAVQRADFPAPDDAYGAWRVFGVGCQCGLPYSTSLLYCHCQASVVPLDPHFEFRDALLEVLLHMENNVNYSMNRQSVESRQLRFQYKGIVGNAKLQGIANQAFVNENNVSVCVERLFLQTFAALRKDGIVSLLDEETDTYLLVSRERVLEPYCNKLLQKTDSSSLERRVLQTEQPAYLRNVANARLQYVKKTLTDNR